MKNLYAAVCFFNEVIRTNVSATTETVDIVAKDIGYSVTGRIDVEVLTSIFPLPSFPLCCPSSYRYKSNYLLKKINFYLNSY